MSQTLIQSKPRWTMENRYQPVEVDMISLDTVCKQEIYIRVSDQFVLFRNARLPFRVEDRQKLKEAGIQTVYVLCDSEKDIKEFFESNLSTIIDSPRVTVQKKAEVLYQCATGIAQDIFNHPENKENIGKSREVVNNTISLMAQSSDAFVRIISLSSHDYYTYSHCVNVMTFTIGLLNSLGVKDPRVLKEVGMGALLHDIGKAKVPLHVLNKPAPLTDEEWVIMKQHPSFGLEMLHGTNVPERGKTVVVQHHEKLNGTGYPYGLKGDQIPLISQVVSLCDAYDAMTTNRVYKKAMKPFTAFKIIANEMRGTFDPVVIEKFIELLNLKNRGE